MNNQSVVNGIKDIKQWGEPIKSSNAYQVNFLKKFVKWIEVWDDITNELHVGGLTRDTSEAAVVCTNGMIHLIFESFLSCQIEYFEYLAKFKPMTLKDVLVDIDNSAGVITMFPLNKFLSLRKSFDLKDWCLRILTNFIIKTKKRNHSRKSHIWILQVFPNFTTWFTLATWVSIKIMTIVRFYMSADMEDTKKLKICYADCVEIWS